MNNIEQLKIDIQIYELLGKLQDKYQDEMEHYDKYGFSEAEGIIRQLYVDEDHQVELLIHRALTVASIRPGQFRSLYSVYNSKKLSKMQSASYVGTYSMNFFSPHKGGLLEVKHTKDAGFYEPLQYDDIESGYFQYSTMHDPAVLFPLMLYTQMGKQHAFSNATRKVDIPEYIDYNRLLTGLEAQLNEP